MAAMEPFVSVLTTKEKEFKINCGNPESSKITIVVSERDLETGISTSRCYWMHDGEVQRFAQWLASYLQMQEEERAVFKKAIDGFIKRGEPGKALNLLDFPASQFCGYCKAQTYKDGSCPNPECVMWCVYSTDKTEWDAGADGPYVTRTFELDDPKVVYTTYYCMYCDAETPVAAPHPECVQRRDRIAEELPNCFSSFIGREDAARECVDAVLLMAQNLKQGRKIDA